MGSFLPGHQQEQKPKKQRIETISPPVTLPVVSTVSGEEMKGTYGIKPILTSTGFQADNSSPNPIQGYNNSAPENKDNSSSLNTIQAYRNSAPENKSPLAEEESKGLSQPNCEVSC